MSKYNSNEINSIRDQAIGALRIYDPTIGADALPYYVNCFEKNGHLPAETLREFGYYKKLGVRGGALLALQGSVDAIERSTTREELDIHAQRLERALKVLETVKISPFRRRT